MTHPNPKAAFCICLALASVLAGLRIGGLHNEQFEKTAHMFVPALFALAVVFWRWPWWVLFFALCVIEFTMFLLTPR